uniref:C2H2-type domain-containing protein n=1 Tax=Lygus hesperus TaxID=30085 RepID=A0A0A9XM02_LYGHE
MAVVMKELEMQANSSQESTFLRAFDPGPPTSCKLCLTEFNLIAIHKKLFHSGMKEKRCAFCAKQFISRSGLLNHLDVHSDGSDLFCCYCLDPQISDDALSEHVETHRELHVFLCYKCSKTFATKSGFSGHDCVPHLTISGTDLEHHSINSTTDLSTQPSEVLGEDGSDSVHRLVKIEQRHVRLSESTFSESLAPRVSDCKSPGEPLQNRDDGDADHMTNHCMLIDIKNEISHVKDEFDKDRNPVAELNSHSDQSGRTASFTVKFYEHEDPMVNKSKVGDQNGETVSVTVEFEMNHSPVDTALSPNHDAMADMIQDQTGVGLSDHHPIVAVTLGGVTNDGDTVGSPKMNPSYQGESGHNSTYFTPFSTNTNVDASDHCVITDPLSLSPDTAGVALDKPIHIKAEEFPETFDVTTPVILPETPPSSLSDPGGDSSIHALHPSAAIKQDPTNLCTLEDDVQNTYSLSPPPVTTLSAQSDPGGDSNNFVQCPSTAVNVGVTNPGTTEAELSQQAALPSATTPEKDVPEESHTNPRSLSKTSPCETPIRKYDRTLRSTRKRPLAATFDSVNDKQSTPPAVETHVNEPAELRLTGDSAAPTPPDSPSPPKKKRISFNEQIEYWNPTLRERVWLDLTDEFPEVREVPLLKVSSKKSKKKSKKKKKSSKSKHKKSSAIEEEESPGSDLSSPDKSVVGFPSYGLTTPTKPKEPLRPVLKPSPLPQVESPSPPPKPKPPSEPHVKKRGGRLPAQSDQLYEKFGSDFSYIKCLKVDGRFHCPDNDCCNNNDRGFATDKGLRNHIRQHHITAPTFDCSICNKSWTSAAKLRQHMSVHNSPDTHSCSICDKKFKTEQAVRYHKLLHSQPFQCYHCQKKFSRKVSIKTHLRWMKCECCEIEFRCAGLFSQHEDEVPHQYECTRCDKKCKRLQIFNWHVRNVHYNESTAIDGNWICHVCDRKYVTRQGALRHARTNHKTIVKTEIEPTENL